MPYLPSCIIRLICNKPLVNNYQSSQHKSSWVKMLLYPFCCLINGGHWCGAEFPITFRWLLQYGWYPCSSWRTERWMQSSLCDFRLPGPSSLWCMKPCVSPRLQYVWVVFLSPFCCACCNVMYWQTGTDQKAGFKHSLSTSVRQTSLAVLWCECV